MPERTNRSSPTPQEPPRTAEELRRLTSGFLHEVNNALNPVLAAAFLLDQKAGDVASVREIAAQLKRTAEDLGRQSRLLGTVLRAGAKRSPLPPDVTVQRGTPIGLELPPVDPVTSRGLAASPSPAIRVLIADDQAQDRSLMLDVLQAFGHVVVAQATSGDDAIAQAGTTSPDAVLLDVHMPGVSGIEAAKRIREASPDTAIVLFTGDATLELSDDDLEQTAAVAFLAKPAAPKSLDASLRVAVRKARELKAAREEAADAKRQLANRKLIDRAKGLLMARMSIAEPEAYRFLQRTSQNRAVPLVEIARIIVDGDGALS
ncbi:MAG: response regulator [Gemmatimonadaceae bacterium]|nr:response regulator [Gemmatimonadaceae bacterium]